MSDEKNGGSNNIFITSHNQSGGITAHTVNVGRPPREIDTTFIHEINKYIPEGSIVNVNAVAGDQEAFSFAENILTWLRSKGYRNTANDHGVDQAFYNRPMGPLNLAKIADNEFLLTVGSRQHPT